MCNSTKIIFEKYHGLGNDYLIFDPNKNHLTLNAEMISFICNRHFGVGSDGILIGPILQENTFYVQILNPDGSEAEKSGNGICIFSKYLKDAGYIQKRDFDISTLGGTLHVHYLNEEGTRISVSMGKLSFWSDEIPVTGKRREVFNEEMIFNHKPYFVTCASLGNPHCIIPLCNISKELVCSLGPFVEHAKYFPNRINLQLLKVLDREHIQIEIYERGVGYTLASGSCSCAAAGVAYKLGLTESHVMVQMPGGELEITIEDTGELIMTGDVEYVAKICLGYEFSQKLYAMQ